MKLGKIMLEEESGRIISKKLRGNIEILPEEILWIYHRREEVSSKMCCGRASFDIHSLVVVTRERRTYRFPMDEAEVEQAIELLKGKNAGIFVSCPKGSRIRLENLPNTRDLGGLQTRDGRRILPGRLIRSGALHQASSEDRRILVEEHHLKTVVDFRTETEKRENPDPDWEGVMYIANPITDEETTGISREKSHEQNLLELEIDADQLLMQMYPSIAASPVSMGRYGEFFRILLQQEEGAVLWHCSAGKDRAGIGTALVLSALDVPEPVILADYMRTGVYLKEDVEKTLRRMEQLPGATQQRLENVRAALSVKEAYLNSVFQYVKKEYGSMEQYLKQGIGLTKEELMLLKNMYLV